MNHASPSMLKPTLIGGGAAGVAGALPVLGALNVCCCSLVLGGGFLAAYLYSRECQRQGSEFRPGTGALVGLLAGLFYAVGSAIVGGVVRLVLPQPNIDDVIAQLEQVGASPEVIDLVARFMESGASVTGIVIMFFVTLVIAAIFSTLGGLIGGAVFKVAAAPAAQAGAAPPPQV